MEEIGIVKSTDGESAKVIVERKSACDQCTEGTCKVTDSGAEIEALNFIRASEGQKVKVVVKPYSYLKGSILIYGIPALALILGAILGKEFLPYLFRGADADVLSAIGGFTALVVSFIIVRSMTSRMEKKTKLHPVIEEIIEN